MEKKISFSGSSSTFEVFAKEGFQERIRNQVSASFTIGNNNGWSDGSELLIGGMGISGSSFTGSVDEIRLWNTPLSESRIDNHALNGDAIDAVESGVKITESDINNRSVGIGGMPDMEGHVTLDACIMDHKSFLGR